MSELAIHIDGRNYTGWKKVSVPTSFESVADSFNLELLRDSPDASIVDTFRTDDVVEIRIDGETVITGYIDAAPPTYDAASMSVSVIGRSKTADLIDCSFQSNRDYKGKTLLEVADDVCLAFDINVEVNADVGAPFEQSQRMETGETVFEFLERLARYRAVRLTATPDGNLLITRSSRERIDTPLVYGQNIVRASGQFSNQDRFSDYSLYGQQTDPLSENGTESPLGRSSDSRVGRYRPTVIIADGNLSQDVCQRQADWHAMTRYGRSQGIVYTALGWKHADGLWAKNRVVRVVDPIAGIDADRIIAEAVFTFDDQGERTELLVVPTATFDLVPVPEPEEELL